MLGRLLGERTTPAGDLSPDDLPPGITIRTGRLIPALGGLFSGMNGPAAAVALGRTIVVHPRTIVTKRLLRHELAHCEQWRREPFTFPLRYIWRHVRCGYRDNPYEIEARAAERPDAGRHGLDPLRRA